MGNGEIAGSRVAIVGGSIAGCAAAIALSRAGCEVSVFERSTADLADRGFGIALPASLHDQLVSAGYLDARTPHVRYAERSWFASGRQSRAGRELARQPFPAAAENWGILWRALRGKVPDGSYEKGTGVTRIAPGEAGAQVFTRSGARHFDLVVGADGYRSLVKSHVSPGSVPQAAGYGIWRGSFSPGLVDPDITDEIGRSMGFFCFPEGHAGAYMIPDAVGEGGRLVYGFAYLVPRQSFADLSIRAPGTLDENLADVFGQVVRRYFPPRWAAIMSPLDRQRLSMQPVFDATAARYAQGRLVLTGDAGAVARPHTASGATTALQDALALERRCAAAVTWEEALGGYDRERCAAGNTQTELARRLGAALVLRPPDWNAMNPGDFPAWWAGLLTGQGFLYE